MAGALDILRFRRKKLREQTDAKENDLAAMEARFTKAEQKIGKPSELRRGRGAPVSTEVPKSRRGAPANKMRGGPAQNKLPGTKFADAEAYELAVGYGMTDELLAEWDATDNAVGFTVGDIHEIKSAS